MIRFLGLDVHRKMIRACITGGQGEILSEHNLDATREEITSFAKKHLTSEDHVALEATFNSWAIADVLEPFVAEVVVSNPLATKAIAQSKCKTDKVDARVLAQLLRCGYLPQVWIPDSATRQLRSLCSRRGNLVSERVRIKNRLHGVLAKALIPLPLGERGGTLDLFEAKGLRWLASLDLEPAARAQVDSDLRLLALVDDELLLHDKALTQSAWEDPRVKLLMTLPGVQVSVALAVLAAFGDIERFRDADHAASYLGLTPSTRQSADHCYHGPITKRGNSRARWLLIQAAQHLGTHPGPLGVFFRRLNRRKGRNVAVVATARKLAVITWHMLTQNEPYRYALPRPTQDKLAKLRVKATGKKRKTGTKKGTPQPAHRGTGQKYRTIPPIAEVYQLEELPIATPPDKLKPGEARMLQQQQVDGFVASIQQPATLLRKAGISAQTAEPTMAGGLTRSGGRACLIEEPHARRTGQDERKPDRAEIEPAVERHH